MEKKFDNLKKMTENVAENGKTVAKSSENDIFSKQLDLAKEALDNKERELNATEIETKNTIAENKKQTLASIFKMMEEAGVNLRDQSSIRQFLEGLSMTNPDLVALIQDTLDSALGEDYVMTPPPDTQGLIQPDMNMMA